MSPTIVYFAGESMDTCPADDVAFAEALSQFQHVLWVDPDERAHAPSTFDEGSDVVPTSLSPSFTRLRQTGSASPIMRLARRLRLRRMDRRTSRALELMGATSSAVIVADPVGAFPESLGGHRVLYVTDDWVSDAPGRGRSRRVVQRAVARNSADADTVAATSHTLAERMHVYTGSIDAVRVVPGGCVHPDDVDAPAESARTSSMHFAGALDDRIDYDVLNALVSAGHSLTISGPRPECDHETTALVESLLSRPAVSWSEHADDAVPSVGILPFRVDAFTRAMFPSAMLDYLAAGIPVVSTDLPAPRWLNTPHVAVTTTTGEFVRRAAGFVAQECDEAARSDRRALAARHTWTARARTMLRLAGIDADACGARTGDRHSAVRHLR